MNHRFLGETAERTGDILAARPWELFLGGSKNTVNYTLSAITNSNSYYLPRGRATSFPMG